MHRHKFLYAANLDPIAEDPAMSSQLTCQHYFTLFSVNGNVSCICQVSEGQVTLTAEVNSIYTLTTLKTGHKGNAGKIPPPTDFPLPYKDNFDGSYTLSSFCFYVELAGWCPSASTVECSSNFATSLNVILVEHKFYTDLCAKSYPST